MCVVYISDHHGNPAFPALTPSLMGLLIAACARGAEVNAAPTGPLIFNLFSIRDQPHQSRETGETLISESLNGVASSTFHFHSLFLPFAKRSLSATRNEEYYHNCIQINSDRPVEYSEHDLYATNVQML